VPRQPVRLVTARLSLRRPAQADAVPVLGILSDPSSVQLNPSDLVTKLEDVEALVRLHWARSAGVRALGAGPSEPSQGGGACGVIEGRVDNSGQAGRPREGRSQKPLEGLG